MGESILLCPLHNLTTIVYRLPFITHVLKCHDILLTFFSQTQTPDVFNMYVKAVCISPHHLITKQENAKPIRREWYGFCFVHD